MKTFGTLLVVYVAVGFVQGYPEDSSGGVPKCAGTDLIISDTIKSSIKTCASKFGKLDKLDEAAVNTIRSCPMVCITQALGVLDTTGKPVKDKLDSYLKEVFPPASIKDLTAGGTECFEKYEKSFVLKDGDCSSYNDFTDCIAKILNKVCMP